MSSLLKVQKLFIPSFLISKKYWNNVKTVVYVMWLVMVNYAHLYVKTKANSKSFTKVFFKEFTHRTNRDNKKARRHQLTETVWRAGTAKWRHPQFGPGSWAKIWKMTSNVNFLKNKGLFQYFFEIRKEGMNNFCTFSKLDTKIYFYICKSYRY